LKLRNKLVSLAIGAGLVLSALPNVGAKAAPGDFNLRYSECGGLYVDLGAQEHVYAAAPTPDGGVVVAGQRTFGNTSQIMLARMTSTGAFDESFGDGGIVLVSETRAALKVLVQPDGKILVLGSLATGGGDFVARFNSDGSSDSQFGADGEWVSTVSDRRIYDFARQSTGKILLASNQGVIRLTADGVTDGTLGADAAGRAGNALAIDSLGRFALSDFSGNIRRFNAEGLADSTWGESGVATSTASQFLHTIRMLADDSLIAQGASGDTVTLVRLTSAGVHDTAFGSSGSVSFTTPLFPVALTIDPSNRILVSQGTEEDSRVARYTSSGILDSTFGADGVSESGAVGKISAIVPTATGIVVAGDVDDGTGTSTNEDLFVLGLQDATFTNPPQGLEVDGWGGVHSFTTCGGEAATVSGGPYWPGWSIVRGIAATSSTGGLILDGWGGLHPVTINGNRPTSVNGGPYWQGWDITRGVAMLPDGTGGYVLDGWGGLHPFGVNGHAPPPAVHGGAYWAGWDIARGLTILPDGSGGYVVDGFGGLHPFSITGAAPPPTFDGPYWYGWDIVRGVAVSPGGTGGYIVDGYGGPHTFAIGSNFAPEQPLDGPYWNGWDIARGVTVF
jgi:uncharacterized delta-60 repeat protein